MKPLICRWLGRHRPKQYSAFVGSRSMFQHTVDRAIGLAGAARIVAVTDVRGVPAMLTMARQLNPDLRCAVVTHTDEESKWLAYAGVTHVLRSHRALARALAQVVSEPVGGAHRDPRHMASQLKRALVDALRQVSDLKPKDLLQRRYDRLQAYGRYADTKER